MGRGNLDGVGWGPDGHDRDATAKNEPPDGYLCHGTRAAGNDRADDNYPCADRHGPPTAPSVGDDSGQGRGDDGATVLRQRGRDNREDEQVEMAGERPKKLTPSKVS